MAALSAGRVTGLGAVDTELTEANPVAFLKEPVNEGLLVVY